MAQSVNSSPTWKRLEGDDSEGQGGGPKIELEYQGSSATLLRVFPRGASVRAFFGKARYTGNFGTKFTSDSLRISGKFSATGYRYIRIYRQQSGVARYSDGTRYYGNVNVYYDTSKAGFVTNLPDGVSVSHVVQGEADYAIYSYTPQQTPDALVFGTVEATWNGKVTLFDVAASKREGDDFAIIGQVTSDVLTGGSGLFKGNFELPEGYPENRSYGGGRELAPREDDAFRWARVHHIIKVSTSATVYHEPQSPSLFYPYSGISSGSYRPKWKLEFKDVPDEFKSSFLRINKDEIFDRLKNDYKGLTWNGEY